MMYSRLRSLYGNAPCLALVSRGPVESSRPLHLRVSLPRTLLPGDGRRKALVNPDLPRGAAVKGVGW